jgi:hypothetical protein
MLSKSIAHSEQLAAVSLDADYLFARCIPHLDREGRMPGHPNLVKSVACPLRPEITAGVIPDLLRQLAGAGLVRWYEVDGKHVLEFPGFHNHQKGGRFDREAESRYPAYDSPGAVDLLRTNSGPTPAEVRVSRSEGEVKVEVEVEVNPPGDALARVAPEPEWEVLPEVPGDTGGKVVALRPFPAARHPPEVPFGGMDWAGRVNGSHVLREWINLQPAPPSQRDRDRYGRACKRIADEHTCGEIALAFLGMSYTWPYGDPKTGAMRETWTPEHLAKEFVRAFGNARLHPTIREMREDRELDDALDEALNRRSA